MTEPRPGAPAMLALAGARRSGELSARARMAVLPRTQIRRTGERHGDRELRNVRHAFP